LWFGGGGGGGHAHPPTHASTPDTLTPTPIHSHSHTTITPTPPQFSTESKDEEENSDSEEDDDDEDDDDDDGDDGDDGDDVDDGVFADLAAIEEYRSLQRMVNLHESLQMLPDDKIKVGTRIVMAQGEVGVWGEVLERQWHKTDGWEIRIRYDSDCDHLVRAIRRRVPASKFGWAPNTNYLWTVKDFSVVPFCYPLDDVDPPSAPAGCSSSSSSSPPISSLPSAPVLPASPVIVPDSHAYPALDDIIASSALVHDEPHPDTKELDWGVWMARRIAGRKQYTNAHYAVATAKRSARLVALGVNHGSRRRREPVPACVPVSGPLPVLTPPVITVAASAPHLDPEPSDTNSHLWMQWKTNQLMQQDNNLTYARAQTAAEKERTARSVTTTRPRKRRRASAVTGARSVKNLRSQ
jgi:hypothetical protein